MEAPNKLVSGIGGFPESLNCSLSLSQASQVVKGLFQWLWARTSTPSGPPDFKLNSPGRFVPATGTGARVIQGCQFPKASFTNGMNCIGKKECETLYTCLKYFLGVPYVNFLLPQLLLLLPEKFRQHTWSHIHGRPRWILCIGGKPSLWDANWVGKLFQKYILF